MVCRSAVERDDAVAARLVGEGDQQADELVVRACAARRRRAPGCRNAATTVGSGNCSSTAPMVPPKTIRAAVGCRIWPRLPPSISRPATMPAMARNDSANAAFIHDALLEDRLRSAGLHAISGYRRSGLDRRRQARCRLAGDVQAGQRRRRAAVRRSDGRRLATAASRRAR